MQVLPVKLPIAVGPQKPHKYVEEEKQQQQQQPQQQQPQQQQQEQDEEEEVAPADTSVLRPNLPPQLQLKKLLKPEISVPCATVIGLLLLVNIFLRGQVFESQGRPVPLWKVCVVMDGIVIMVVLMTYGMSSEVVLICGAAIFSFLDIIQPANVLAGLSDSTVTSVALLFPMAQAIADTGALGTFVSLLLGSPRSLRDAIVRVCVLVGLLSAIVNNTPCIATMLPILEVWCQRIGQDVKKFAMPMAFAAQLGGTLTMMGSPTNFASRKAFSVFGYNYGFFELTGPGFVLFIIGVVWFALLAPLCLGEKAASGEKVAAAEQVAAPASAKEAEAPNGQKELSLDMDDVVLQERQKRPQAGGYFKVFFRIDPGGTFSRSLVKDTGFERLKGVKKLECVLRNGEPLPSEGLDEQRLQGKDLVIFQATAEGVAALRASRGITLPMEEETRLLGSGRRNRCLFEVELPNYSDLVGRRVDVGAMRFSHKCAFLAIRSRALGAEMSPSKRDPPERGQHSSDDEDEEDEDDQGPCPPETYHGRRLKEGDVLLLEADKSVAFCPLWAEDFGIVRCIPKSAPPRVGRLNDKLRMLLALVGSALAIAIFVVGQTVQPLRNFTLTNNLIILMAIFLFTQNLRLGDIFEAMERGVLLTIVGAIPLGDALMNVGLDAWVAERLVMLMGPMGNFGLYMAIYIISAGLSQLISNVAVIAMLAPIAQNMAVMQNLPMKVVVPLCTISVASVFVCPIGHQTNQMVTPLGKYSWGDFFKFGAPFQLVHAFLCVLFCMYMV